MGPKEAFQQISVEGCSVRIDNGPERMLHFGCGFLVPANTLGEVRLFINALGAGHKQHHSLGHPNHAAPREGWGLDTWLFDDDVMMARCPVDPPRPQDYVYVTCGYAGPLPELTDDWVRGLDLEL